MRVVDFRLTIFEWRRSIGDFRMANEEVARDSSSCSFCSFRLPAEHLRILIFPTDCLSLFFLKQVLSSPVIDDKHGGENLPEALA